MNNIAPVIQSDAKPNEPNAPSEIIPLPENSPATQVAPDSPCTPQPSPPPPRKRRRGKIAQLPKKLRDLINEALSDGATYGQVVQRLNQSTDPPLPYAISQRNISDWQTGPYQEWLRHQDHLDILSAKFDFAIDLAQNSQPDKLQELCLQLAAIRMTEFLSELAISDPQTDPAIYLRLLSALPRISKEALNLQKYRDASMKPQNTAPADNLTAAERAEAARTALLDQFDDIMGLKSYRKGFFPSCPDSPQPSALPESPGLAPQSKIENQNSKITAPEPSFPAAPQVPNSADSPVASLPAPLDQSKIANQNSKISSADQSSQPIAPHLTSSAATQSPESPEGTPLTTPPRESKIANQNSKIPETPPTETYGNLQKVNPAPEPVSTPVISAPSTHAEPPGLPESKIKNQKSKIAEFCLECSQPLPALLPDGARPSNHCEYCNFPLPPPGSCREPSVEQCPMCRANLPRVQPDGHRPSPYCHNCGTPLPLPTLAP